MDVLKILADLRRERERIEEAILTLERLAAGAGRRGSLHGGGAHGEAVFGVARGDHRAKAFITGITPRKQNHEIWMMEERGVGGGEERSSR